MPELDEATPEGRTEPAGQATPQTTRPETLEETRPLSEAAGTQTGRRRRIQLIDAGWSKNGRYYGADTLREAASRKVFRQGTPMYADHPTVTEAAERPERSIKDLAARLTADARFEGGALVAEAELFGPWQPVINDLAEHIGVSIRAAGTLEYGEAEGREGPIVTAITEGISVDFVTSPARGGKILESARGEMLAEARNIGAWLESRLHLAFTQLTDDMYGNGRLSREERIALSSAVGDALSAFVAKVEADQPQLYERDLWQGPDEGAEMDEAARAIAEGHGMTANDLASALSDAVRAAHGGKNTYAWTCDHTDEWVVYRVDTDAGKGGGLYQQAYEVTDGKIALTGKPAEVVAHTTYTPAGQAPPAPQGPAEEAAKNAPGSPPADQDKEGEMPELTEAEARELTEARDKALADLEQARAELTAERTKVAEAGDVAKRVTDLEEQLKESAARNQRLENDRQARARCTEALKTSGLPELTWARVTESVCRDLSTVEGGGLDDAKLTEAITAAIDAEKTYVASLAEAAGAGMPRGLGGTTAQEPSDADIDKKLTEAFKDIGLDERAAATAATGRGF